MTSSANNSTNTPLNGGANWVGLWESPADTIQGVQLLINTNVSGTAYIQFSQDRSRVEYEHAYGVIGGIALYKIERRKAKYVRVKYINDASAQTLMLLHTTYLTDYEKEDIPITIDAEDSNILMFGELPTGALQAVKLDASGNLKVSGISGGGISSDVNVTNGLLQVKDISAIEQMTIETDRILYDTDIIANRLHDISGSVSVSNFPTTQDISGSVSVSNFPTTQDISGSVSVSNFPTTQDISGSVSVSNFPTTQDISGSVSVSNFPTTQDISGSVSVSNFPTLQETHDASSVAILETLNEAVGNIELNTTILGVQPVHLSLSANGDEIWADGYAWHSPESGEQGWEYINEYGTTGTQLYYYANAPDLNALSVEPNITLGSVECGWFIGNQKLLTDPDNRFIMGIYTQPTGSGDAQFWYHSRRAYQVSSSVVLSKAVDYFFFWGSDPSLLHPEYKHIELSLATSEGDCDPNEIVEFMSVNVPTLVPLNQFSGVVKQAGFVGANTIRNVYFDNDVSFKAETQLGLLDFSGTELLVRDASAIALLAEIANGITVQVGEVDISGATFTDAKLNVFDSSSNEHLTAIEDILETGFINVFDSSANVVLDKLTFVDTDISNNLLVIDSANNAILSQLSFFTNDDTILDLRVKQMGSVEVINPEGQTLSVSGNVGIIADQTLGISGSVQTHNFASSNGTDWHHLASDANGRIITLARTHDGYGNDITSTLNGGVRALDVAVSGVPVVEISGNPIVEISGNVVVSASANQYGSYGNLCNNVASILPAGVSSGIDVSAWSYFVGAYQDYYNSTPTTGFLRLQYSFDNSVYYDLFNTTISPSGAGTPRTATIQKQDIPSINWIRFKNDTNGTMTSITITLLGGSLS